MSECENNSFAGRPSLLRSTELLRDKFLACVGSYLSSEPRDEVERAWYAAEAAHRGQRRRTGEPFIHHPTRVAFRVASRHRADAITLVSAQLHDTVECGALTLESIEDDFSAESARHVDSLTKVEGDAAATTDKLMTMSQIDSRAVVVKIHDRIDNLQTLYALPDPLTRRAKAEESVSILAPLALDMGLYEEALQLQQFSLPYLGPVRPETRC